MNQVAVWPLADQLKDWAPGETESVDVLDPAAADALHRLTGVRRRDAECLAPLDHWVYFHTWASPDTLAPDGYQASVWAAEGRAQLSPLVNRRRMFAGGRCWYQEPLSFGSLATARSSVARWNIKQGRSGEVLLVTVQTNIGQRGRICLVEVRGRARDPPRPGPAMNAAWTPDENQRAWAQRVVAAADADGSLTAGVLVIDGQMVDQPLLPRARRLLASISRNRERKIMTLRSQSRNRDGSQ